MKEPNQNFNMDESTVVVDENPEGFTKATEENGDESFKCNNCDFKTTKVS